MLFSGQAERIVGAIDRLEASVRRVETQLARIAMRMGGPRAYARLIREEDNGMLVYQVTAGPPQAADVVERRLTATVNGEVGQAVSYPASARSLGEMGFEDGAAVTLSLVDVDDAGNQSEPATLDFVATDTIPPVKPGEFGVTLLREE